MKTRVLLISAVAFCLQKISEAQATASWPTQPANTISLNDGANQSVAPENQSAIPTTGGYQGIQPLGPNQTTLEQPPTNELLPSERQNVIQAASQKLWRLLFTFGTGVYYDDNILISHTNKLSDTVFTLDGGFSFELGDYRERADSYFIAKYLGTELLYTDHSEEDSFNQNASILGQYRFSNFTFQSDIVFSHLNEVERTVGTLVSEYLVDGQFRLRYDLSEKTQLFAQFEQITNLYPKYLNSFEYIGTFGADYSITPKIKLGLAGVLGSLHQEDSPSSFYGQGLLRAAYQSTEKLTFRASAGFEIRNYSHSNLVKVTPVFDLGFDYNPFVDTIISLVAFRKVFASPVLVGQYFNATGVELALKQNLFKRFTAGVTVGYERDDYSPAGNGAINIGRTDNYVYVRPSLTYDFRNWLTAMVYEQFGRNDSSVSTSSFTDNRVGGQISITF